MYTPTQKQAQKRFYQRHKAKRQAQAKAWKENNRQTYNIYMREYRAKRKQSKAKEAVDHNPDNY